MERNLSRLLEAANDLLKQEYDMSTLLSQKVCSGCRERTEWMVILETRKLWKGGFKGWEVEITWSEGP